MRTAGYKIKLTLFVVAGAETHSFRQKGKYPAEGNKTKRRRESHLLENSPVTVPDVPTCTKTVKTLARRAKTQSKHRYTVRERSSPMNKSRQRIYHLYHGASVYMNFGVTRPEGA